MLDQTCYQTWSQTPDNAVVGLNAALKPESNVLDHLSSAIKKILLPQGYPESVSGDYMRYQIWDTLQVK